jgi:phosphoglycerate dehydrogenase-like enzyme
MSYRTVFALSELEKNDFLPEPLWNQATKLLPQSTWVELPLQDDSQWEALLKKHNPEILVTAWRAKPLPKSLVGTDGFSLKYVCHLPGSVRKLIPREYIEKGVTVTNWGSSISPTISECALMLVLNALRQTNQWNFVMHHDKKWRGDVIESKSLFERRVGIHGFGAIAQSLIPLLKPFRTEVWSYSPSVPDNVFNELGVKRATSLDQLFSECGIIVELAPNTPKNYHVVTEKHLRSIPEPHVFVNVGRGAVVEEAALLRVAKEGKLRMGLDVFETEPLPENSELRGLRNVMLLPHLGGPTPDRRKDSGEYAVRNLERFLKKEPLGSLVTLDVYDRAT